MDMEQAMMKAMTDKKHYKKPKQEQEKRNTVSHGVSAILETINERDRKEQTEYARTDHFNDK